MRIAGVHLLLLGLKLILLCGDLFSLRLYLRSQRRDFGRGIPAVIRKDLNRPIQVPATSRPGP